MKKKICKNIPFGFGSKSENYKQCGENFHCKRPPLNCYLDIFRDNMDNIYNISYIIRSRASQALSWFCFHIQKCGKKMICKLN